MGVRANYIVVDDAGYRVHHSHWGGVEIDLDLAPGPEHALRFIAAQEPVDEWLEDLWCEGAALVDTVGRELLWFGGDDHTTDLSYRRACFALLAQTWPGWTVRWAHDGIADAARHVGLPAGDLLEEDLDDLPGPEDFREPGMVSLASGENLANGDWTLVTVRRAGGPTSAWAVAPVDSFDDLVLAGPGLPDLLETLGAGAREIGGRAPYAGIHVDAAARTAGWWTTVTAPDTAAALPDRWAGWDLAYWHAPPWHDGYDRHVAACAPDVRVPAPDVLDGLARLETRLARGPRDPMAAATTSPPDAAAQARLAAALAAARRQVTAPPRTSP